MSDLSGRGTSPNDDIEPAMTGAITGRVCSQTECQEAIAPDSNGRWGRWTMTRAHGAGWYIKKDGTVFCPQHRPHYAPVIAPARGTS